jgi:hypothetical protein
MVYVATSGGTFSIRPWEPFQYLSNSRRRAASSSQRPDANGLAAADQASSSQARATISHQIWRRHRVLAGHTAVHAWQ